MQLDIGNFPYNITQLINRVNPLLSQISLKTSFSLEYPFVAAKFGAGPIFPKYGVGSSSHTLRRASSCRALNYWTDSCI